MASQPKKKLLLPPDKATHLWERLQESLEVKLITTKSTKHRCTVCHRPIQQDTKVYYCVGSGPLRKVKFYICGDTDGCMFVHAVRTTNV